MRDTHYKVKAAFLLARIIGLVRMNGCSTSVNVCGSDMVFHSPAALWGAPMVTDSCIFGLTLWKAIRYRKDYGAGGPLTSVSLFTVLPTRLIVFQHCTDHPSRRHYVLLRDIWCKLYEHAYLSCMFTSNSRALQDPD